MDLHPLTPHIFYSFPEERSDRPVLGIVAGNKGALMVEAGASPNHTQAFLSALMQNQLPEPTYAAVTHWHWDHVFGIAALNCPIFAHFETTHRVRELSALDWSDAALDQRVENGQEITFCRDCMKVELSNQERARLELKAPNISFSDKVCIDLGGVEAWIIHVGGDHSSDSSVVFIPSDGVVFLGDCLCNTVYGRAGIYTADQFIPLLENLLKLGAGLYLSGHTGAPIPRQELDRELSVYQQIARLLDHFGQDRERIITELETHFPINEDDLYTLDSFLLGWPPSSAG